MTPLKRRDLFLGWSLLPYLTPSRTRLLLEWFDPPESVCNASSMTLAALLNIDEAQAAAVKNPLQQSLLDPLRESSITLADDTYPALLREIPDPPLALHLRGDRTLLARAAIAVVGSRRASPYGINVARELSRRLASDAALVIVSGLARGVDTAAHQAALDAGGTTIAVLGTGIDVVYPRSNRRLFDRIATEGLIVSEFPPGTPPLALNFPMRNRVISGLCTGTLIVEATSRSGSLITARMAAEQGREVFAVPGSIFSEGSEGTHRLIQYGAKLVHDVGDIVCELPGMTDVKTKPVVPVLAPELREVFAVLSRDEGTHVDVAATRLGRSVAAIAEALLRLELDGWVEALPGSRYVRTR
jgi:DNA processing protein